MIIYILYCRESHKGYVGQTIRPLRERWLEHLRESRNPHFNDPLNRALRKYGASNFESLILAKVNSLDELNILEEEYIKQQNTLSPSGYNLKLGGGNHKLHPETKVKLSAALMGNKINLGRKRTPEAIAAVSAGLKGRKLSEEHKSKIRERMLGNTITLGYKHTSESRRKMGERRKGKKRAPFSVEWRAKLSAARAGKTFGPLSAEHREKIRLAKFGKKRGPQSAEWRAKIGAASKGRVWSLESRKKLGESKKGNTYFLGHHQTPEARAKIGEASRCRWARRKANAGNISQY